MRERIIRDGTLHTLQKVVTDLPWSDAHHYEKYAMVADLASMVADLARHEFCPEAHQLKAFFLFNYGIIHFAQSSTSNGIR